MERGSAHHGPRVDDGLASESAALLYGAVVPAFATARTVGRFIRRGVSAITHVPEA